MLCVLLPPLPHGVQYSKNFFFYRAPGGKWAGYPQQQYTTAEPGKVQGQDRMGIIERSCGYRARGVSVRGKFVLSRNPGYKTKGSPCG